MQLSLLFNDRQAARHIQSGGFLENPLMFYYYTVLFIPFIHGALSQGNIVNFSIIFFSIYGCNEINKKIDRRDFIERYLPIASISSFLIFTAQTAIFAMYPYINDNNIFYTPSINFYNIDLLFSIIFVARSIFVFQYLRSLYISSSGI
jgi:hypothetical protein